MRFPVFCSYAFGYFMVSLFAFQATVHYHDRWIEFVFVGLMLPVAYPIVWCVGHARVALPMGPVLFAALALNACVWGCGAAALHGTIRRLVSRGTGE